MYTVTPKTAEFVNCYNLDTNQRIFIVLVNNIMLGRYYGWSGGKTPKNTDKYGPLEFLSTTAPATIRPFATDYEKKLAHAVTGLVLHHIFIHHQHCKKWK